MPKAKVWPRPNYRALAAAGMSTANLMVIRTFHASLPTKPRAAFHFAAWRHSDALKSFRDSALIWLHSADQSPLIRFDASLLNAALTDIMSRAFGEPSASDPCYYTRRHVVDHIGCQLYALLGDEPPRHLIPKTAKLDKLIVELNRGWPTPPPPWERRRFYIVPKHALSIESRGTSSFARWPGSTASDKGVIHTFTDHTDARDWHHSLSPHLVITDRPSTRLVSSHDTFDQAMTAVSPTP